MEYRTLNNGIRIPQAGFGTWDLRGRECVSCIAKAIDTGYRLIDTAIMYGNEKEVGEGIRASGIAREELFVTTKVNSSYASYEKTKKAVEHSLSLMKLDYLDLVLIHEPYREYREMYRALEEMHREGKIRAIGVSNLSRRLYDRLLETCEIIPAVNQVECHVYYP
jgi:diketogulonate reductase-like aldo/keto reductase